jgi:hypothetical protein
VKSTPPVVVIEVVVDCAVAHRVTVVDRAVSVAGKMHVPRIAVSPSAVIHAGQIEPPDPTSVKGAARAAMVNTFFMATSE